MKQTKIFTYIPHMADESNFGSIGYSYFLIDDFD